MGLSQLFRSIAITDPLHEALGNLELLLMPEFNLREFAAEATLALDAGPALLEAAEEVKARGAGKVVIPKLTVGVPRFETGVVLEDVSNMIIEGEWQRIINDAIVEVDGENKNGLFFLSGLCENVWVQKLYVDAVATGDFTGGRNPKQAVFGRGIWENVHLKLRASNHQTTTISYGTTTDLDPGTDPELHYIDGLHIWLEFDGDCGPEGDGSGINIFPKALNVDNTPKSRNLYLPYVKGDVTRGSLDRQQHGPQCVKVNAVDGVFPGVLDLVGSSSGCMVITSGCRNVHGGTLKTRRSDAGLILVAGDHPAVPDVARTEGVHWDHFSYDDDGVLNANKIALRVGQLRDVSLPSVDIDGGDLQFRHDPGKPDVTAEDIFVKGSIRGGNVDVFDPDAPEPDMTGLELELVLDADGVAGKGRVRFEADNWPLSKSKIDVTAYSTDGNTVVRVNGDDNKIKIRSIDGNPDNDANVSLFHDDGQRNEFYGEMLGAHHIDYGLRRTVDGVTIVKGMKGVAETEATWLVGLTELPVGDLTVKSQAFTLSGALTDELVMVAPRRMHLLGVMHYYTVASSADAGVNLRVGKRSLAGGTSAGYFHVAPSEASVAVNTSRVFPNDGNSPNVAQRTLERGELLTVRCDGGKVGAGQVIVVMVFAPGE